MSDSDVNETGINKGPIPQKSIVVYLGDYSGDEPCGYIPLPIPPVRSDETNKKNSSSKSSDAKKE